MATAKQVQAEFDAFKAKVVEVGVREAEKRGWCSEFERIMEQELGLTVPSKSYLVTIRVADPKSLVGVAGYDEVSEYSVGEAVVEAVDQYSGDAYLVTCDEERS